MGEKHSRRQDRHHDYRYRRSGGEPTSRSRIIRIGVMVGMVVILLVIGAVMTERLILKNDNTTIDTDWVTVDGVRYRERRLTTFLIMGLDEFGPQDSSGSYQNSQQADFLMLVAFDHEDKSYSVLHLNRDTMTDVEVLDITGARTGHTRWEQLALAHTYGNGLEVSCLNTCRTVSRLLFGVSIDYYISLTMDAVAILNDGLGGVTLTMPRDYTAIDPAFTEGARVTLSGEQALRFVRARMTADDGTNLSRMERQRLYLNALLSLLSQPELATEETALKLWRSLSGTESGRGAMLTDATWTQIHGLTEDLTDYECRGIFVPQGEADYSGDYVEFHVDREDLARLVVSLYLDLPD